MPIPKNAKVLGQKTENGHLVLYYRLSNGKIQREVRKGCVKKRGSSHFKCK